MEKILFFDGVCLMCNKLIIFVLKHDQKKHIHFATLQGEAAQSLVPQFVGADLTTVVFKEGKKIYTESDAIINLMISLGGIFSLFKILKIVPRSIRNKVYKIVAENRYKWFGKTQGCILLSPEEKVRFLD